MKEKPLYFFIVLRLLKLRSRGVHHSVPPNVHLGTVYIVKYPTRTSIASFISFRTIEYCYNSPNSESLVILPETSFSQHFN